MHHCRPSFTRQHPPVRRLIRARAPFSEMMRPSSAAERLYVFRLALFYFCPPAGLSGSNGTPPGPASRRAAAPGHPPDHPIALPPAAFGAVAAATHACTKSRYYLHNHIIHSTRPASRPCSPSLARLGASPADLGPTTHAPLLLHAPTAIPIYLHRGASHRHLECLSVMRLMPVPLLSSPPRFHNDTSVKCCASVVQ